MKKTFLILLFAVVQDAYGQSDSTSTGQVVGAEIVIEKDQKIILPNAEKIAVPVKLQGLEPKTLQLSFPRVEPDFNWPDYKSDISFVQENEQYPKAIYQNYVLAGFGNYSSPLLEAGFFKQLNKTKFSSKVFHESFASGPTQDKNSANSLSTVDISGKYQGETFTFTPSIGFRHHGYRFYGNTDRVNTTRTIAEELPTAAINAIRFDVKLEGVANDVHYYLTPSIESLSQSIDGGNDINSESGIHLQGGFSSEINKRLRAGLDVEGHSTTYKGGLTYDRSLFTITPWLTHSSSLVKLKAGFSFVSRKVFIGSSKSSLYPKVSGELKLSPKWALYGDFEGGVDWNSLSALLDSNEFLDDSLAIENAELTSGIGGGISGTPIKNLMLKAGVRLDNYKRMAFFVPSASDSSRFSLVYDDRTINRLTFTSEAVLTLSSNAIIGANLDLYSYTVKTIERAWHMPTYRSTIYYSQKFDDKVSANITLIAQGGMEAPVNSATESVKLSSFMDANFSIDYKLLERGTIFVQIRNLFNNSYEEYIGYAVRGATFKLGGRYRF